MKIDSNPLPTPPPGTQPTSAERASQRSVERLYGAHQNTRVDQARGEAGTDQVELSSLGHSLRVEASDSPERNERIEQLAKLVESGKYNPDSREVASRIVDDSISE